MFWFVCKSSHAKLYYSNMICSNDVFVRNLLIVSSYKDYHFKQTPKNTLHTEVTFSTVFSLPSILFFEFSQQLLFIFVHACTGHAHF